VHRIDNTFLNFNKHTFKSKGVPSNGDLHHMYKSATYLSLDCVVSKSTAPIAFFSPEESKMLSTAPEMPEESLTF